MQPPEPANGPTQPSPPAVPAPVPAQPRAPGSPPPAAKPRNRRLRLWLAMGAGVLALLCLGGVGVFISVYDEATEIKRTAPDAVVDSYLRAYLVNRDEAETALYTCEGGDFTQIEAFRAGVVSLERQHSTSIQFSWEGLRVVTNGSAGSVEVDLTRFISDNEQLTEAWSFAIVDQNGWHVCGATKIV